MHGFQHLLSMVDDLRLEQQTGFRIERHHITEAEHIQRLNPDAYRAAPSYPFGIGEGKAIVLGDTTAICRG